MKRVSLLFLLFAAVAVNAQNLRSGGVLKPEQALMDIRHYTVVLDVDPAKRSIAGDATIDFITSEPTNVLLFDLTSVLAVTKVWLNSKEVPFTHTDHVIRMELANMLPPGKASVKIRYGGKPAVAANPPWVGGFQWETDSAGHSWVAITCQSEGAKIYFPCKDHPSDEPNEGADLIITVPKGLYVAGPGLLKKVSTRGAKSTYHWKTNYTINTYNIVFNIGDYTVVQRPYTSVEGHTVPMQFYVLKSHAHQAAHHLDVFEQSVRVQEKYFGEYPWIKEKLAICETPHLGMEHQTLNAYGNQFRYVQLGGKDYDWLLHHELGHEWWANKVTGIDWADMWIQEGICSFGDALYFLEYGGPDAYQKHMQATARDIENKKPIVQGKNLDSDAVYHADIYGKAAFFMHTLRYIIGDDIFFSTLKKLATDPQYTYDNLVDTEDVQRLFNATSGMNLDPFFDLYLRTTNKLEILVKQTDENVYMLQVLNLKTPVPIDVRTDAGTRRVTLSAQGMTVTSKTVPVIDPEVYYIKRVILE